MRDGNSEAEAAVKSVCSAWEADTEYTDWQWRLARTADGSWQLLTRGY